MEERKKERGQAMVETVLVLPILLLLMVGVVEVGAALRNYLAVANAAREGARFAARGYYLSDSEIDYVFDRIINASGVVDGRSFLRTEGEDKNAEVIITYVEVISSVTGTYNEQAWRLPEPWEYTSTVSADQIMEQHGAFEGEIQSKREEAGYDPTSNDVVVVEIFFDHDPFWGEMFNALSFGMVPPSDWLMYASSEMRVILDREGG